MVLRHILSILLLPTVVTVLVPYFILSSRSPRLREPLFTERLGLLAAGGGGLILIVGLTLVITTIRHFATVGRGTLAPWDPPRRLVVTGVYRYVRNPMISGVLLVLCGETLLFNSAGLLTWTLAFFAINAIYIPLLEEPMLAQRFGNDYELYRRSVPRWVPRVRPWEPPAPPEAGADSVGR
jgi:protein-S-isoprenylcysteine O-methyltransferase Ste14